MTSIPRDAIRTLLITILLQCGVIACDATSRVAPNSSDRLTAPGAALTVSASGLSATAVTWSEIDLSWASSPSASGYQIFRSTDGASGSYSQISSTGPNTKSYANTGLTGSTQYCYEVRSFKVAGKNTSYGAYAGPVCATTLPPPLPAPTQVDAVPEGSGVRVKWKDNSSNEDGFSIERASAAAGPWGGAGNAPANATSLFVPAQTEQLACFRVTAFSSIGPSAPSTPDCTTLPAGPSGLSAQALDLQSITLSWTDNSAVEDGYLVARTEVGGTETNIATLPPNTVTYRDASVRTDVAYTYRVLATKDGGLSSQSNYATAVVSTTPPATPSYFQVNYYPDTEGYGWNYLTFYWGDASSNEDGFRIESSGDGSGGWSTYLTAGPNTTSTYVQFSVFEPPPGGGCWRVIAFNSIGESGPSNISCVEPGVAPTDLTATAVDQQTIDLTWTDNANIESGYVVIRGTAIDNDYSVIATLGANATSYHDTGLASGQDYWYLVAAVYPGGNWSDYSNYATATTPTTAAGSAGITSSRTVNVSPSTRKVKVRVKGHATRLPPSFLRTRPALPRGGP